MKVHPKRIYSIASLQRGLNLLTLFSKAEGGLAATQVAKLSALPVSTVHRFLMNLEATGFLHCDEEGGYHLGAPCFSLGQAALPPLDLRRLTLPYLQELDRATRETVP